VESRFKALENPEKNPPAFDLVRAGVNLTAASILIAFATSLKLPLSTTYVSFMVAMGTSLSDRAWGRDSAVYRVAGVLNVIGGWFATAFIAFSVSGIFALLIYYFGAVAIGILIVAAVFFVVRGLIYHKAQHAKKEKRKAFEASQNQRQLRKLIDDLSARLQEHLTILKDSYAYAVEGLLEEKPENLKQADKYIHLLKERNEAFQYELFQSIQRIEEKDSEGSRLLLFVYDLEQDMIQSATLIVEACQNHVKNRLNPLDDLQIEGIRKRKAQMITYLESVVAYLQNNHSDSNGILKQKHAILEQIEWALSLQVDGIKSASYGARNSQLVFKLYLESKDLVAIVARFVKLYGRFNPSESPGKYFSFSENKED
jgi:hypothetical protein